MREPLTDCRTVEALLEAVGQEPPRSITVLMGGWFGMVVVMMWCLVLSFVLL